MVMIKIQIFLGWEWRDLIEITIKKCPLEGHIQNATTKESESLSPSLPTMEKNSENNLSGK